MFRYLLVLSIGIAAGYTFGFKDAKEHEQSIVTRTVERIGGNARGEYANDIDGQMDKLEKR
ncbi:MAG: hypothetical protein ABIT38_11785 [Gemmatimonadaceae bacterium]